MTGYQPQVLVEGACGTMHLRIASTLNDEPCLSIELAQGRHGETIEQLHVPMCEALTLVQTVKTCLSIMAEGEPGLVAGLLRDGRMVLAHETPDGIALAVGLLIGDEEDDEEGVGPVAKGEAASGGGACDLEAILIESNGLTSLADALDEALRQLIASGGMLALLPAAGSA